MLNGLKSVKTIKIASSECTNLNLLSLVARKFDKIILSTGMSFESDIVKAKEILELHGAKKIIVMHCVANYPTKIKEMNLNYLNTLKNLNFFKIGLSDHSLNDISSIVSIDYLVHLLPDFYSLGCLDQKCHSLLFQFQQSELYFLL